MAKVFISYSRKDIDFAKKLTGKLQKSDLDFWIDWEGIPPTVDWWREIEKGIEEADAFLFLISPDSAKSKVCGQEIDTAIKNGKRLIPLIVRDVKVEEAPGQLRHLNWIFIRESDDFDTAIQKLLTSIHTDYDWVQTQRRLQVKALEWERNSKESGFLLRSKDLLDAETNLARNTSKEPHPTDLQREYVLQSRKATDRQRRITTGISIAGVVALAALAVWGWGQAVLATNNENKAVDNASTAQAASTLASSNAATAQLSEILAEERARIARSGELAAYALNQREDDFPLSLLLSVEAYKTADTQRTYTTLLEMAQTNPQISEYISLVDGEGIGSVAFNPDGKTMAVGTSDKIILLDVATREIVGELVDSDGGGIRQITFSPNGENLIARFCEFVLTDYTCQSKMILWDISSQQIINQPYNGVSYAISFQANMLAVGDNDGGISLWEPSTHRLIYQFSREQSGSVLSLAFSPDGKILVSGSADGVVVLWDIATREVMDQLMDYSGISNVAFSPDGTILAFSSSDYTSIILWDVATLEPIGQPLKGHKEAVENIIFSPDGKTLASSSTYDRMILWNVPRQYVIGTAFGDILTGFVYGRVSLAFSPDSKGLALGGTSNNAFFIWRLEKQFPLGYALPVKGNDTAYSPDGNLIAFTSESSLLLWDTKKAHAKTIKTGINVSSLSFSSDSKILAVGSCRTLDSPNSCKENEILLWDVVTNQQIGTLSNGNDGFITRLAFNPDGKNLVSSDQHNNILLWDVTYQQLIDHAPLSIGGEISGIEFSSNGHILAVANRQGGQVILYDTKTYKPLGSPLSYKYESYSIAFSPDDNILVAGLGDFLTWWDVKNQSLIFRSLPGFQSDYLAFSPNRDILAVAVGDSFDIWDVGARQPISQIFNSSGSGNLTELAFNRDGMTLLTANTDGTIILWNMNPQQWMQAACQRAGRNLTQVEWTQYFPGEEYRKTCDQWPLEPELTLTPTVTP